jgi:hypothetical protein
MQALLQVGSVGLHSESLSGLAYMYGNATAPPWTEAPHPKSTPPGTHPLPYVCACARAPFDPRLQAVAVATSRARPHAQAPAW